MVEKGRKEKYFKRTFKTINYCAISLFFITSIYYLRPLNLNFSDKTDHISSIEFFFRWSNKFDDYLKNFKILKGYSYFIDKNKIYVTPLYRVPKLFYNNHYYDNEGIIINEKITHNNQNIIKVFNSSKEKNNSNNFFQVYKLFENFQNFTMEYNSIRWNIYIQGKIIKLPIEIIDSTKKKISYLENNKELCFKENVQIIDLRFEDKILLVSI